MPEPTPVPFEPRRFRGAAAHYLGGRPAYAPALFRRLAGLCGLDGRERVLDQTDSITKTALDPYATFRSLYRQHREAAVQESQQDRPATVPAWYQPAR